MTTASSAAGMGEPEAGTNPADAPVTTDAKQPQAVESSPAAESKDANQPKSLLDAVKTALKPEAGPPESSAAENAKSDGETEGDKGEKSPDAAQAAEDETPPFHKHPAWQKRIARERELTGEVEALKPKAERFDAMHRMMTDNGLSPEEVTAGFNIMALMRSDPVKALEALRPYMDQLELITGNKLPDDLTERVESGEMTETAAQEMARLRAGSAQAEARAKRDNEAHALEAQRTNETAMRNSVASWEHQWRTSDPDYAKKAPLVKSTVIALMHERGRPKTVADAVKLSKDALEAVEKQLGAVVAPKPKVVAPVTRASSGEPKAKPKSLREAMDAALSATRSAA